MAKPLTPVTNRNKPRQPSPRPTTAESTSAEPAANRPAKEFRHRNQRATIWKNVTDKGVMYNVTLTRMYREGEQRKDSQSFGFDDLMNLAKLLADAHSYISVAREGDFVATKNERTVHRSRETTDLSPS
jgi:hypothetical protein